MITRRGIHPRSVRARYSNWGAQWTDPAEGENERLMGYIPPDAKWYLAEIVEKISVEGDPRRVIHTNLVLVRGDSPDHAYAKAVELGTAAEISYDNPEGKRVAITYCGLRDLNVIHGDLEHGTELIYSEEIDMDPAAIQKYISPKEELGIFAPRKAPRGPNYISKDVVDELQKNFPDLNLNFDEDPKGPGTKT